MDKEYDHTTAFHYAAYRPPLHSLILKKCMGAKRQFKSGLDIGCGTGLSAEALRPYCTNVVGIDPSMEMLAQAVPINNLHFLHFNGKELSFEDAIFDIITFAGSWYYAQSQQLLKEVIRVSKSPCKVILYDFEIDLGPTLSLLNIDQSSIPSTPYNHAANFFKFDIGSLSLEQSKQEVVYINITATNLVHLLLSSKENYHLLETNFGEKELFQLLKNKLLNQREIHSLKAILYYTIYVL